MTTFTAGPWRLAPGNSGRIWNQEGTVLIAHCNLTDHVRVEERKANAALMVMAPKMFEALQWYATVEGDTRAAALIAEAMGEKP